MNDLTLQLSPAEGIRILPLIDKAATEAFVTWRKLEATNAPRDEADAAKDMAALLARVGARLQDLVYPAEPVTLAQMRLEDRYDGAEFEMGALLAGRS